MKKVIKTKPKVIKKPIIYTQYGNAAPLKGKIMDDTLNTIPDQTKTIRELLDNHSRGIPLDVKEQKGEYFDTEIPRFDDLTDLMEYKAQLKDKEKELNKQIAAEKTARLEKLKELPVESEEVKPIKEDIKKLEDL